MISKQYMLSRLRQAVDRYKMLESGNVVAVGLSGGKDSVALLTLLAEMRRFYPQKFEVKAVSVDMGFDGTEGLFDPHSAQNSDAARSLIPR